MSGPALVLVGPMGAGKTSIGRRVAKALGERFVDTDALVVREHGPISDLFRTRGEDAFRAIERDVVSRALREDGVVSLGGGAVLDPDTRDELVHLPVAFVTVTSQVVAGRIQGATRPLLGGEDPLAEWERIYALRLPLYRSVADVEFDTSRGPVSDVVAAIAEWAGAHSTPGAAV